MHRIFLGIIFAIVFSTNIFAQTNVVTPSLSTLNQNNIFKSFPNGLSSLLTVPDSIEEMKLGYTTVFVPKGYGKTIYHYGIWNAIPFVVFDNSKLELRFGLIFEHRQNGFLPDEWINTSLSGENLPDIEFLIPNMKTFLNFSYGASQWRATVLLTDEQLKNLDQYVNSTEEVFTVKHRFIDSSFRPYLIGLRHKSFFQMMLLLYKHIEKLPQIKKFQGSDSFPAGAFFEELSIETVTTEEEVITEELVYDEEGTYESGEYDDTGGYDDTSYAESY